MRKSKKLKSPTLIRLKKDLAEVNRDWSTLLKEKSSSKRLPFLKKIAGDILTLEKDARKAKRISSYKDQAELINHLLTTPWGAPFVGETTLLHAAESFDEGDFRNSALFHLADQLSKFGHKFENQTFQVFEDLENEL